MVKRITNFNAGPSTLPLSLLEEVKEELLDYKGRGLSIMEMSHRSAEYEEINNSAMASIKSLLGLGDDYSVLFLTGGASSQFAMIPMNFRGDNQCAAYVDTGAWSTRAIAESKRIGNTKVVAQSKEKNYSYIPNIQTSDSPPLPDNAAYLHVTSNNTIFGTQYQSFPDSGNLPLICDMSSDICSRELDFSKFSMIYAGSQKNLGPAGTTLALIKTEMLDRCRSDIPTIFDYRTHASKHSLYNTPPVFTIYMMNKMFGWIKKQGGLKGIEKTNRAKQERIYQLIDLYPDFYRGTARHDSRSWMNITFRLPSEELETLFIAKAKAQGMIGIKGHRSVGGIRVSLYNAQTIEGADKMATFMDEFKKENS